MRHPCIEQAASIWESTFTTLCSLVSQPVTAVRDLSQSHGRIDDPAIAEFTPADITYLKSTVSSGSWHHSSRHYGQYWPLVFIPLANVSGGGIGYVFENSNFTKTQSLYATASSSYTLLFRYVNLGTQICSQLYLPANCVHVQWYSESKRNHTFPCTKLCERTSQVYERRTRRSRLVNRCPQLTLEGFRAAISCPYPSRGTILALAIPGPKPTFFRQSDNYGNTYCHNQFKYCDQWSDGHFSVYVYYCWIWEWSLRQHCTVFNNPRGSSAIKSIRVGRIELRCNTVLQPSTRRCRFLCCSNTERIGSECVCVSV